MIKKLLPVLLALALLFTAGILYAQAEEAENVFTEHGEAIDYLRERLVAREKNITFTYTGEQPISLLDALAYEGSAPNEGDYLRWSISSYTQQEYAEGRVECTVFYRTSAEKEAEIANAVSSIVSELTEDVAPEAFSEYRRAVLIFNWLCDNVAYLDESNTSSAYSAYSALIDRTAKCEGYALAFYRLAREMGLDCRILTGYVSTDALEISHAWNAFRIGESWYYADSTHGAWSGNEEESDRFAFFMMPGFWDGAEYVASYTDGSSYLKTAAEIADYPFDLPIVGSCPEGGGWTLYPASGQLILAGESAGETETHWKEYAEIVTSVSAENGVIDLCVECLTAAGLPLHCGDESEIAALAADESIPCHTSSAEPVQPPTCKNTGRSAGTVCGICELYLTGGETLPVTDDHTDNGEGVCSVCGIVIDCVEHGFCGTDVRWYYLQNGTLGITGSGNMTNYKSNHRPWEPYIKLISNLDVGDGITSIGAYAFYRLRNLTTAVIPDSVTVIEEYAFAACVTLQSVRFPANLKKIEQRAFYTCSKIEELVLPSQVESLGIGAFEDSGVQYAYIPASLITTNIRIIGNRFDVDSAPFSGSLLETVEFEPGMTAIPDYCCAYAKSLTTAIIPDSVKKIGKYSFCNCTSLSQFDLPQHLETIGMDAFRSTKLSYVFIPASVTEIQSAFSNSAVQKIEFENGMQTIPSQACQYAKQLTEVIIPDSVTEIGGSAFSSCNNLTQINLPENLSIISTSAFGYCTALISISIPNSVTEIERLAFRQCPNLRYAYIPDSSITMFLNAFQGCPNLNLCIASKTIEFVEDPYFPFNPSDSFLVHCPTDSTAVTFAVEYGIQYHTDLDYDETVYGTLCTGEQVEDFVAYCRECGKTFTKTGVIDENGHMPVTDAAVAPTCTADGKTEGSHCSVCGTVFTAQETIPALGHFDTLTADETPDGICDVCGTRLWAAEEPEPEPQEEPVRITKWFTNLFEGIAKFFSNLIKMIRRMFG